MFKRYYYTEGLTPLTNGNDKYLINYLGQVKDHLGNDVPVSINENGHQTVNVHGWDGLQKYRIIDLMAIQFKSLKIPNTDYNKVIAFNIDGDKNNLHASNIGYRFLNGKLEVVDYPGFYYIPGFTHYAISENGAVYNHKTKKLLKWFITQPNKKKNIKGGYFAIRGYFSRGVVVAMTRHRAIGLVFLNYPDNSDSMTINHKDGIPGNDSPTNLEWLTRSNNNLHAYMNDLKSQNMKVLVRNVLTGEVNEYYSICETARVLNLTSDESVRNRIYGSKFGQVFEDGTQIKLKSDSREWIIPLDPYKEIKDAQQKHPIVVRNCLTMVVTDYDSISDAAKVTGIDNSTISYRLMVNNRSPLFGFQFKLKDDINDFQSFTLKEYTDSLNVGPRRVTARNVTTGEIITYDSVRNSVSGVGNSHTGMILRKGNQQLLSTGWQLKYEEDEWEEYDNLDEIIYKLQSDVLARNEDSGEIISASSSPHMASLLGLNASTVRESALTRGNRIYSGYRFRLGVSDEPWPSTNYSQK